MPLEEHAVHVIHHVHINGAVQVAVAQYRVLVAQIASYPMLSTERQNATNLILQLGDRRLLADGKEQRNRIRCQLHGVGIEGVGSIRVDQLRLL